MRKRFMLLLGMFLVVISVSVARASEADLNKELEILKQRVAELEMKLEQAAGEGAEENGEKAKARSGEAKEKAEGYEEIKPRMAEVKEEIKEQPGLEFHGGAVSFYQGATVGKFEGGYPTNPSGAGIITDLQLTWKPGAPLFENGRFFLRAHYGSGKGADKDVGDMLFANLNTIADDSDDTFQLPEAYYAHEFLDGSIVFAIGKTEPLVFIDNNAFANNGNQQFVGKPFVNNPLLDSEDEYAPIVAASFSPVESISFTAVAVSSSFPNDVPKEQKSVYDNIFDAPLVAGQFTYSPKFGGLQGNYRIYGWGAPYKHIKRNARGREEGWGVGLSLDQQVTQCLGLFGRLGYGNKEAYDVNWFWSVGADLKGFLPSRDEDHLGVGIAGLTGDVQPDDGTELHAEAYYRIFLTDNFAISPDFQYVVNPRGNSDNGGIFVGMLRGEFTF